MVANEPPPDKDVARAANSVDEGGTSVPVILNGDFAIAVPVIHDTSNDPEP